MPGRATLCSVVFYGILLVTSLSIAVKVRVSGPSWNLSVLVMLVFHESPVLFARILRVAAVQMYFLFPTRDKYNL